MRRLRIWSGGCATVLAMATLLVPAAPAGAVDCLTRITQFELPGDQLVDVEFEGAGGFWALGQNPVPGGHGIYQMDDLGFWHPVPGGAVEISVGRDGQVWVVNDANQIYRRAGSGWQQLPGLAQDVEVGADGSVWAIGTDLAPSNDGWTIHRWNGGAWDRVDGAGVNLIVDAGGQPWVTNGPVLPERFFRRTGGGWQELPGLGFPIELSIGGGGARPERIWALRVHGAGYIEALQWNGAGWDSKLRTEAFRVSVDYSGQPWLIGPSGQLHAWGCA